MSYCLLSFVAQNEEITLKEVVMYLCVVLLGDQYVCVWECAYIFENKLCTCDLTATREQLLIFPYIAEIVLLEALFIL